MTLLLSGAAFTATLACSATGHVQPSAMAPLVGPMLVFDNVTVIDVERGNRLPEQRVVIVGNRIRTIGSVHTVRVPAGAQVIEARGKYLIPGLWDMHIHPAMVNSEADYIYPLLLANGVTGIRDAWSIHALDTLLQWRREMVAGTRIGPPRQLFAGVALDDGQPCKRTAGDGHACVADTADARHVVDSLKAAGADFIKTYALSRPVYFAVAAEARRIGIPFGGHVIEETSVEASDSGARIEDHVHLAGNIMGRCVSRKASLDRCKPIAEHFINNGTWWCPTLAIYNMSVRIMFSNPNDVFGGPWFGPRARMLIERFYNTSDAFWDEWNGSLPHGNWLQASTHALPPLDTMRTTALDSGGLLRFAHRLHIPILAGTDGGINLGLTLVTPGLMLHTELAVFVAEGMTPLEALQAATLNPAKSFHGTDSLGTVAVGKLADLVLLDADPLTDITNTTTIRAVVANGHYYDRAKLDQLLANVVAIQRAQNAKSGKGS